MQKTLIFNLVFLVFSSLFFLCGGSLQAQKSAELETIDLLKSKNFDDWSFHFDEPNTKGTDIYSFTSEGELFCKGMPFGYIATKKEYKNFKLSLEYTWPEEEEPTNSGIFLRISDQKPDAFLPCGFEVQLAHGSAGDLWGFYGKKIAGPKDRLIDNPDSRFGHQSGVPGIAKNENKPGEWNKVEVLLSEGLIVVVLNGKIVNWASDADTKAGKIGFQSEGGHVKFRNVRLSPLP